LRRDFRYRMVKLKSFAASAMDENLDAAVAANGERDSIVSHQEKRICWDRELPVELWKMILRSFDRKNLYDIRHTCHLIQNVVLEIHRGRKKNVLSKMTGGKTVSLVDNDINSNAVIPGPLIYSSYLVSVSDTNDSGSSATFLINGSVTRGGTAACRITTIGSNNEQLTISWVPRDYPRLKFMNPPTNPTGAIYTYLVNTTVW